MLVSRQWPPVLAMLLGLASIAAQSQAAPKLCQENEHYQTLLDWVGEWQVIDENGAAAGSSLIRSILHGCAFEEMRRRGDGSEQLGLTFHDPAASAWRQRWLSSSGDTGLFELEFDDDRVAIRGSLSTAEGSEALIRALITPRLEGGFEEQLEISLDGGNVYSAAGTTLYLPPEQVSSTWHPPPQDAAPAPKPTVAPAPVAQAAPAAPAASTHEQAVPSSAVKVRSRRKAEAPIPETAMESPMTLEFELGPLADLPPGAAWRTTELAPYVADRINIPRVTAQRRERRGKTELELVVNLRTRARQSKVDLDVTLLSGDVSVASERQQGIALGKLVRAHDPKTGLAQTVRLAVDSATFAALFADGKRPSVRLTVTVR